MSTPELMPTRSWREIAQEVLREQNHDRALELAEELIRALDAERRPRMEGMDAERTPDQGGARGS